MKSSNEMSSCCQTVRNCRSISSQYVERRLIQLARLPKHVLRVLVVAHDEVDVEAAEPLVAGDDVGRDLLVGRAEMRAAVDVVDSGGEIKARHQNESVGPDSSSSFYRGVGPTDLQSADVWLVGGRPRGWPRGSPSRRPRSRRAPRRPQPAHRLRPGAGAAMAHEQAAAGSEYPSLKIAGFGDVNFAATEHVEGPRGFSQGQFALHMTSALSPRVTFFGEISFSARSDAGTGSPPATGFNAEIERMILRFDRSDQLKVSFGRYHTPINWWNTFYHHGQWLQTSIQRPEMTQFGGRFLPVHFVGALVEGALPAGGLEPQLQGRHRQWPRDRHQSRRRCRRRQRPPRVAPERLLEARQAVRPRVRRRAVRRLDLAQRRP